MSKLDELISKFKTEPIKSRLEMGAEIGRVIREKSLIESGSTQNGSISIPNVVIQPPIQTGIEGVTKFWELLLGTPEQKGTAVLDAYSDVGIVPLTKSEMENIIQKFVKSDSEAMTTPTLSLPFTEPVELPEMPDVFGGLKNIAIVGIMVLVGVYLAGKWISKK